MDVLFIPQSTHYTETYFDQIKIYTLSATRNKISRNGKKIFVLHF